VSARVIPLDDTEAVKHALADLARGIEAGRVRAFALVAVDSAGGFEPSWGAARSLGPHAGSILRGAVAYLAAVMDAEALE
jgi:hypothetical protein